MFYDEKEILKKIQEIKDLELLRKDLVDKLIKHNLYMKNTIQNLINRCKELENENEKLKKIED